MSKSSRPSASVFGALGPDDVYFGNRVQAAARDAQQRWPLLGGMAPAATQPPPELSAGDKSRWEPQPPLVPSKPAIARPSLSKKLEAGLDRLTQQTRADEPAPVRGRAARVEEDFEAPEVADFGRAVRAAPTQPAPLMEEPPIARSRVRASASEAAPRPRAPEKAAPASGNASLGDVFRRLAQQAAPAPGPEGSRKSILGRLGKR